jgi:hypothetical protein
VDEYTLDDVKQEVLDMKVRHLPFAVHWYTCAACTETYVCEVGLGIVNSLQEEAP